MLRLSVFGTMAAALAVAILYPAASSQAQTYPTRPVTVVTALAAGTGVDIAARIYSEQLKQKLGQPFVVENRPGAAQRIAIETVQKAPADGYTLGVATSSAMAIRPTMLKNLSYDPLRDFVPIAQYLKSPFVLVVNPNLPVKSVKELIAYIKARPDKLTYAISSIGSAPHLSGELMKQHFGLQMAHAAYKNSPQAFADVAAGHVPMAFADAGTTLSLITSGKLRALAVTSTFRLPTLPDVPTMAEAAGIPGCEAVSWHVLFVRASTPPDIVDKLHKAMVEIMADKEVNQRIAALGLLPHPVPPVAETQRYIKSEIDKWGDLLKKLGLAGKL